MLKRMDFQVENVPNVMTTCVTLHNICEIYGDHFESVWEVPEQQDDTQTHMSQVNRSPAANTIHNALTQYLSNN